MAVAVHPPAHVFAEDALGQDQRNLLRCVNRGAYETDGAAIEVSALFRAYAKPLLVALVVHVISAKLVELVGLAEAPELSPADRAQLGSGIARLGIESQPTQMVTDWISCERWSA